MTLDIWDSCLLWDKDCFKSSATTAIFSFQPPFHKNYSSISWKNISQAVRSLLRLDGDFRYHQIVAGFHKDRDKNDKFTNWPRYYNPFGHDLRCQKRGRWSHAYLVAQGLRKWRIHGDIHHVNGNGSWIRLKITCSFVYCGRRFGELPVNWYRRWVMSSACYSQIFPSLVFTVLAGPGRNGVAITR